MIAFSVIFIALLLTWYKEPRIFLFFFHKIVFPPRKGKPLNIDKGRYFPESRVLEENWQIIKQELEKYTSLNQTIPRFHEVDKANHKISFDAGPAWRTIILKAYDGWFSNNCQKFPETTKLLRTMNPVSTAMFSILEPKANIPAHTGKFSGIYRYHLAVAVPKESDCFIVVDKDKYHWKEGEGVLFNDTYLHHVENNTNEFRAVLFLDIKKKGGFIFDAINKFLFYLVVKSPIFKRALKTGKIKTD